MEADLSRYHNIDYRDRWRFDDHGRRRLTLRMILVRLRYLPADSATTVAQGGAGWTINDYLTAHVYTAIAHEDHPAYPTRPEVADPAKDRRRNEALARARERKRAIEAGEIT